MNASTPTPDSPRHRDIRELLQDPALWAWAFVVALALLPARAALRVLI